MTDILEKGTEARKRLESIFSRKVLGSILISTTIGRILKVIVDMASGNYIDRLAIWIAAAIIAVFLFMWWEKVSDTAEGII